MSKKKEIAWSPVTVKIKVLKPHEDNPRIMTELSLKELEDSIDDIGMAQPININIGSRKGVVLSGHARYLILLKKGVTEVTVMVPNRQLTLVEEKRVLTRMNKNQGGTWDFDVLANKFDRDVLIECGFKEYELVGYDKINQVNSGDENSEWVGMPDFEPKKDTIKIVIHFDNVEFREKFADMLGINKGKSETLSWSTSWPAKEKEDTSSLKYE